MNITYYAPYSARRTPYPQKHQQTLGETSELLWKTAADREFSAFLERGERQNALFEQTLTKLLKATYYLACSGKQTSYPQKRQQRLGASPAAWPHLSPEKTFEKPQFRLVVF